MNTEALAVPASVAQLRARATVWWRALAPRERQGATLALLLVAVAAGWFIAVQPALRTLRSAPAAIDKLDAELQQMQLLATESRALRAAPPVAPPSRRRRRGGARAGRPVH